MDYVFEDKKREPLYKLMDGVFTKKKIKIELYLNDKKAECETLSIARYDVAGSFPKFQVDPHAGFMMKTIVKEYLKKSS